LFVYLARGDKQTFLSEVLTTFVWHEYRITAVRQNEPHFESLIKHSMWRNYLKISWRNLVKDKTYSSINIIGLTIGLTSCMLVGTVVLDELSYDRSWANKDQLYRILTVEQSGGMEGKFESAYMNLGDELKQNFPEVEASGKVTTGKYSFRLDADSKDAIQLNLIQADTNVWDMLDFRVLEGNPQKYVAGVGNLVITEDFSAKNFPGESPVGKVIYSVSAYQDEARPFLITGVISAIPSNSYLRAEAMQISAPTSQKLSREGWGFYEEQFILMKAHTDITAFTEKVNRWYAEFVTEASPDTKKRLPVYEFQPIEDIYLKSDFANQDVKGNESSVYLFSGIAAFLLLIACINYVNLTAARSIRRIRESGVRKVLGAGRRQLVAQFLCESLLFFVISSVLSCSLYALSMVHLERFLGHTLEINMLDDGSLAASFILLAISLSLIAGLYPAWMVSGFPVGNALKNRFGVKNSTSVPTIRRALVTTQFVFALLVLIGTVTVWSQMNYIGKKDLGYDPSGVLSISTFATENRANTLKQQISQLPGVEAASLSGWAPTRGDASMRKEIKDPNDPDQPIPVNFIIGDIDMPEVLGFRVLEGRSFDVREADNKLSEPAFTGEKNQGKSAEELPSKILITASTAKLLGIAELGANEALLEAIPVGIIEDFHSISLRDPIKPTVILASNEFNYASLLVKVKPGNEAAVLNELTGIWNQFYPEKPLEFDWLDEMVKSQYETERIQAKLFFFFALLMLFLAVLGVFGLVVHATEQRIQEIGVRKVLGASIISILHLFSVDYLKLVGVALLVASPLAWYGMNSWLNDFAYKISLQWWMFIGAGIGAAIVALATVSVRVVWAARLNPAKSLRSE